MYTNQENTHRQHSPMVRRQFALSKFLVDNPNHTHSSLKVLIAAMAHMDSNQTCYPSLARLAEAARVHRRTAARAIDQLKAMGILIAESRGPGRTHLYSLVEPAPSNFQQDTALPPCSGEAMPSPNDIAAPPEHIQKTCSENPQHNACGGLGEKAQMPNATNSKASRFEEWWAAFGKKVKKAEAEKLWKKHSLDQIADDLIADAVKRHQKDDRWLRGFQPDPTTYLRNERWKDEITPPRAGPSSAERSGRSSGSVNDDLRGWA